MARIPSTLRSARRIPRPVVAALCALAFLAGLLIMDAGRGHAADATAYVRVDRHGYPAAADKRGRLLAPVAETGATFRVVDASGRTAHAGSVGPELGPGPRAHPYVYALDFDTVTTPGSYTIEVTGPAPATSPRFRVVPAQRARAGIPAPARTPAGSRP